MDDIFHQKVDFITIVQKQLTQLMLFVLHIHDIIIVRIQNLITLTNIEIFQNHKLIQILNNLYP